MVQCPNPDSQSTFKNSTNFGIVISSIPNCPKLFSYFFFHFPIRKIRGLRFFSLNSRVILKMFEAKPRTFSILPENLMKKIEIHVFSLLENEKKSRKTIWDSQGLLDITFHFEKGFFNPTRNLTFFGDFRRQAAIWRKIANLAIFGKKAPIWRFSNCTVGLRYQKIAK